MDNQALIDLLNRVSEELDDAWLAIDTNHRRSTDPPDQKRILLVSELESVVPYRFTNRS